MNPLLELAELRQSVENARWQLEREGSSLPQVFAHLVHDASGAERPRLLALAGKSPVGTPLVGTQDQRAASLAYLVWRNRLLEGKDVNPVLLWVEALRVCREFKL